MTVSRRRALAIAAGTGALLVPGVAEAKRPPRKLRNRALTASDELLGVDVRTINMTVGPPPDTVPLTPLPPQPGGILWSDTQNPAWGAAWSYPGAMVTCGRASYAHQNFLDISAAGGHVLVYLDAVVWNDWGRYHDKLFNVSEFGSAVAKWPGPIAANEWGDLADFRPSSPMHSGSPYTKLEQVLELIVSENSHIAGFFMDDVGSRSWFPLIDWSTFGTTNQQNYRDGAILVCQAARRVCDRHGLFFLVNGTWEGGTLAASGGGYPVMGTTGNALAEGFVCEGHDGQASYFGPYVDPATTQWAELSTTTNGVPFSLSVVATSGGVTEYRTDNHYSWITQQFGINYDGLPPTWGTSADFHPTGLPSHT